MDVGFIGLVHTGEPMAIHIFEATHSLRRWEADALRAFWSPVAMHRRMCEAVATQGAITTIIPIGWARAKSPWVGAQCFAVKMVASRSGWPRVRCEVGGTFFHADVAVAGIDHRPALLPADRGQGGFAAEVADGAR